MGGHVGYVGLYKWLVGGCVGGFIIMGGEAGVTSPGLIGQKIGSIDGGYFMRAFVVLYCIVFVFVLFFLCFHASQVEWGDY